MPSQHVCNCGSSKEITGEPTPPVFKEPFTCVHALLWRSAASSRRTHRREPASAIDFCARHPAHHLRKTASSPGRGDFSPR